MEIWKSALKRDHVQKIFREFNSLAFSLVQIWFDGKKFSFFRKDCDRVLVLIAFPHLVLDCKIIREIMIHEKRGLTKFN